MMIRLTASFITLAAFFALPVASAKADPVLTDTVLMRNVVFFSADRATYGASAAMIDVDGKAYVLTAKHLLGDAMGIEPAVKPSDFDDELELWLLMDNAEFNMPSDPAEPISVATGMLNPDDDWSFDLMVLTSEMPTGNVSKHILKVADTSAKIGDRVFMVGCPYLEEDCLQKTYGGTVEEIQGGKIIYKIDNPPVLSGFSGAPVLNGSGEIVAVVYGGGNGYGSATIVPDWLKIVAD